MGTRSTSGDLLQAKLEEQRMSLQNRLKDALQMHMVPRTKLDTSSPIDQTVGMLEGLLEVTDNAAQPQFVSVRECAKMCMTVQNCKGVCMTLGECAKVCMTVQGNCRSVRECAGLCNIWAALELTL